jgi:DNA-binding NarL/FixJ family response regulator
MIEANEINSTFYALRLLSHGLDVSELDVTNVEEYPGSEFCREEQEQGLKIIQSIEESESVSSKQLTQDKIDFYVVALADRIEKLANNDLASAGYDVETNTVIPNESLEADQKPDVLTALASIRVLIVDDHALVRAGIRALLERIDQVEVVGEASNGPQTLELIEQLRPEVVLLDLTMPGLGGFEVLKAAADKFPDVRIIVLTVHEAEEYAFHALRSGAAGYLPKSAASAELELAIEHVMNGKKYVSPSIEQRAAFELNQLHPGTPPLADLTPRQREVLALIAEGRSTKDIARALSISVKTVETHRAQIMDRLGVRDLASLVRWALRNGLLESGSVEGSSRLSDTA